MARKNDRIRRQVQEADYTPAFKSVVAKNYAQQLYLEAIQDYDVVFGIGSAGTGKTFIASMYAAEKLYYREVDQMVVTRPNVEASAPLGFLPGELEEKYAPYLEPFDGVFTRVFGKTHYELLKKREKIVAKPLGFMRGATFDNAIVLVDECQNMTEKEFNL